MTRTAAPGRIIKQIPKVRNYSLSTVKESDRGSQYSDREDLGSRAIDITGDRLTVDGAYRLRRLTRGLTSFNRCCRTICSISSRLLSPSWLLLRYKISAISALQASNTSSPKYNDRLCCWIPRFHRAIGSRLRLEAIVYSIIESVEYWTVNIKLL